MKIYAFDVDETLEISGGPVTLDSLVALRLEGHCLGVCGNFAAVTLQVSGWHNLFSFLGPMNMTKAEFLATIKRYVPAEEYIMVGNDHRRKEHVSPDDASWACMAGWRFIDEDAFASGVR